MTHEPLASCTCVTSGGGTARGSGSSIVRCSGTMSVSNPPDRPTQLANNHAWHRQNIIGEHLLAGLEGSQNARRQSVRAHTGAAFGCAEYWKAYRLRQSQYRWLRAATQDRTLRPAGGLHLLREHY